MGEQANLAGGHGQGALAQSQKFRQHKQSTPARVHVPVQCVSAFNLIANRHLQVILQIGPDARHVAQQGDAERLQVRGRSQP